MTAEVWKPIEGYEGIYEVSDKGNVRSYRNGKHGIRKNPIIIVGLMGKHYRSVCLCKDNKKTFYNVHRLVAEAFLPNPENKKEVNHIDGNKLNNCKENLEWASHAENMKHARENDLFGKQKKVVCIETGEEFASITKAGESIGLKQPAMSEAILYKNGFAGGLHWKLKGE